MAKAADAAHALGNVDELIVVTLLDELFKTAMHESDLRYGFDNMLILNHEVKMHGLGKHRMLRAERNNGTSRHAYSPSFPAAASLAAFAASAARTFAAFSGSMFASFASILAARSSAVMAGLAVGADAGSGADAAALTAATAAESA